jgi:predicted O-methyltransferase YrrM
MKKLFIALAVLCSFSLSANPSDAYKELEEVLPFNPFSRYMNASQMQILLEEIQPKIIVESGAGLGASTRHIAQNLPEESVVYAVDSWERETPQVLKGLYYEQFLSNIIHAGLEDKILPLRMHTLQAIEVFKNEKIQPDLIYIDPSHIENELYEELQAYFPLIKGHGLLCGDDWLWVDVQSIVQQFADENNLHIETNYNLWTLRE